MPEFDREGGSRRIFHLIEFFRRAGWAVSFLAQNGVDGDRYAQTLQQMGVATYASDIPWSLGRESLVDAEELVAAGRFDIALLAFWNHAERLLPTIRSLSPTTRVVIDSIDLHFLRQSRRVFCDGSSGALDTGYATEMMRELNVYAAADAVLTVSQKEADIVNDFTGDPTLARPVPDTEDLELSPVPLAERRGMLFIGNYRHPPNVQAVEYLCRDVLPRVRPDLLARHPVYIIGNGLTETIVEYGRELDDVLMVGWVPSILPYLQRARISLIPLVYGAGVRATWLPDERFWYRVATPAGADFIMVDPAKASRSQAFDRTKITAALAAAAGQTVDLNQLPPNALEISPTGAVRVRVGQQRYECNVETGRCGTAVDDREAATPAVGGRGGRGGGAAQRPEVRSPDGKRSAYLKDYNLWVHDVGGGNDRQLTTDGVKSFGYATDNAGWTHSDRPILVWSPDSKKIATFQHDGRNVGEMYLVSTTIGHPTLQAWRCCGSLSRMAGGSCTFTISKRAR
jgi:hypothetical protein